MLSQLCATLRASPFKALGSFILSVFRNVMLSWVILKCAGSPLKAVSGWRWGDHSQPGPLGLEQACLLAGPSPPQPAHHPPGSRPWGLGHRELPPDRTPQPSGRPCQEGWVLNPLVLRAPGCVPASPLILFSH